MPTVEFQPDATLVRVLIDRQVPDVLAAQLRGEPVLLGQGFDAALFRVCDYVVRLPVREMVVEPFRHEITWIDTATARLQQAGVQVPSPVFVGDAGAGFPWLWEIYRWIAGADIADLPAGSRSTLVDDLASALCALHQPSPPNAPRNPYRGVDLAVRDTDMQARWQEVRAREGADVTRVLQQRWQIGLDAAPFPGPPVWLHGDLHPRNVVQVDGRLSGFVDFIDLCAGDPAYDVALAWWTFNRADRRRFRELLSRHRHYDAAIWQRAAAWAAGFVAAVVCDELGRRSHRGTVDHTIAALAQED